MARICKKKISRKRLMIIICIMFISIISLTVAYAALSTSLNISGSANVNQSSWGITVEKYSINDFYVKDYGFDVCSFEGIVCVDNYVTDGNAFVKKTPSILGTSIKDFSVSVSIPGDSAGFVYKVTNTGKIPAKLESITEYTPIFTSVNNNSNDVLWAKNSIDYVLEIFSMNEQLSSFVEGDVLCPGQTEFIQVYVGVLESVKTVPSGTIEISNLGVDYNFIQADMNVCS